MNKIDLTSLTLEEMTQAIEKLGEKPFRAKQIFTWLNQKLVTEIDQMTDLSKALRENLKEQACIPQTKILKSLQSKDGTKKYLFQTEKGSIIESVLMKYEYGNSVCISSQAGCKMGCAFCASTHGGLERNLTAGEMLAQVYEIQKESGQRISNIVVMGTGEPFENFDNLLKFINIINSKEGLEIGQRHITVSTCGIIEGILDFTALNLQVNLAVSLHAPNDKIRKQIMPVAKRYKFEELIEACKYYSTKTKRRITYEYILIAGLNDTEECAKELGSLLRHSLCHVNLIPINSVEKAKYRASSYETATQFSKALKYYGIEATVRRSLGTDIEAACGQLRNKFMNDNQNQ